MGCHPSWTRTPATAYDLVSAASFEGFGGETALTLGRTRRAEAVTYAAFDRLDGATATEHLRLGEVAAETVRSAVDAWPAVAEQWLQDHDGIRTAMDAVIRARSATLARAIG